MNNELTQKQPLSNLEWIHRSLLIPNNYNPNAVAPPELELLKISILADGWTQPIVRNPDFTIVDGFHRWTVSGDPEVYKLTDGFVPVVRISPDPNNQMMSTIRHNRARGTHKVLNMATIVETLAKANIPKEQIMIDLGMEEEEVLRLLESRNITEIVFSETKEFNKGWVTKG